MVGGQLKWIPWDPYRMTSLWGSFSSRWSVEVDSVGSLQDDKFVGKFQWSVVSGQLK